MKTLMWIIVGVAGSILGKGLYDRHKSSIHGAIAGVEDRAKAVACAVVHGSK